MGWICVACGEVHKVEDMEGSMKQPYCKQCYKNIFNNDFNKYVRCLK